MNRLSAALYAAAAASALIAAAPRAVAAAACEGLARLDLPDTTITSAERVTSGGFESPAPAGPGPRGPLEVPPMCRVAGVVTPAIKFEVWMPERGGWNGRFQAVGGGGLAGIISYPAMAEAVRSGYASASTDTGHEAPDLEWVADKQRVTDYGYRAIHEMTVKAKTLIENYYGASPDYAYFNGCSTGGRQGLMEAQRYPNDYDGIVSGAPVNAFTHLHIGQLWTAHATLKTPGAVLSRDDLAMVSEAVLDACDAADGVKDGILADPRTCEFDPAVLECNASQTHSCLAAPQVRALEMIYQGAVNPRTGAQIHPGLEPGSEGPQPNDPGWAMIMNGKQPFSIDTAILRMTFENPDYDWRTFDFDGDVDLLDAKLFGVLNAIDPDMREFEGHGGKLIIYHGWSDPGVMPQRTVDYYESVVDFASKATGGDGRRSTEQYARLFMMPGMGHCRGGNGPDRADFMSAISAWVEKGKAPDSIASRKEDGGRVTMTRPICPYPQAARYRGRGDTNDATSFECAVPE